MKILIAIFLLAAESFAVAQTNMQYITEKVSTNIDLFVVTTNQTGDVTALAESQPSAEDPIGNWGEATIGVQMSIRLEKETFTNGEPINADILLRNVSDKPVRFLFFYPQNNALALILKKEGEAKAGDEQIIKENHTRGLAGHLWHPTIQVGKQYKYIVGLTNFFDLTPGKYKIQAQQLVIDDDHQSVSNVMSGSTTFSIMNSGQSQ